MFISPPIRITVYFYDFSPFSPSPSWSRIGGGPAGHQFLSENAIWFCRQHLHPRSPISAWNPSLYPSTISLVPSLSLSLHPHLSHHSNIFLPISPGYMSIPLKTPPPHAYCYLFYSGLFPYTFICYMVYIVTLSGYPHLRCTYPVFLSLSQRPDLITIHQCGF